MFTRKDRTHSIAVDAALGAASGLLASWLMERAQPRISAAGSDATKAREAQASLGQEPATYRAAEAAAHLVGRSIPESRKAVAGDVVHYATGAGWGALFGVLAPRVPAPVLAAGAAWGALVWLLSDELLVPLLGWARGPTHYPASTHAKALASHLVYGASTDAGYRALRAVTR